VNTAAGLGPYPRGPVYHIPSPRRFLPQGMSPGRDASGVMPPFCTSPQGARAALVSLLWVAALRGRRKWSRMKVKALSTARRKEDHRIEAIQGGGRIGTASSMLSPRGKMIDSCCGSVKFRVEKGAREGSCTHHHPFKNAGCFLGRGGANRHGRCDHPPAQTGFVFTRLPMGPGIIKKGPWTLHALRHSFATHFCRAWKPI